jgi:hypothetical protein
MTCGWQGQNGDPGLGIDWVPSVPRPSNPCAHEEYIKCWYCKGNTEFRREWKPYETLSNCHDQCCEDHPNAGYCPGGG